MSGRNSQVARILCILDLLDGNPNGLSVAEIHNKISERNHSASKRTIYRDLEALAMAGFPLFPDNEDEQRQKWTLERNTRINQYLVLSARELFALFLARGMLTPLSATPFYQDLQNIFQKLEQKLGEKQVDYISSLQEEMKFEAGPQWGLGLNPEVLETVRAACAESHVIECVYASVNSKKESSRQLGPHYLYYSKGGLYLVAEDLKEKKVKVFALPRMKEATMLPAEYEGLIQTPEDIFQGALGVFTSEKIEEVTIEFEADIAQFVKERRWHSSQRVTQLSAGRIRVALEVSQTPELYSWILGFGPNAKVIEPTSLAERVVSIALRTAGIYGRRAG